MEPDEQWAWLLSTIAQTFGALIGIGGMLAVFKLQRIHDIIGKYMDLVEPSMPGFVSVDEIPGTSPEAWVKAFYSASMEKRKGDGRKRFRILNGATSSIKMNLELREDIREDFYQALKVTLTLIIVSIIGLFNCKWLSENVISSVVISFCLIFIIALTVKVLLDFFKSLLITRLENEP